MDYRTKKKIVEIQDYLRTVYLEYFNKHEGNIVGVRIGHKIRNGKELNYYAVIFHVVAKHPTDLLNEKQSISKRLIIELKDGTIYNIPTDVIEVGNFEFQAKIGDFVTNNTAGTQGTLGLFVADDNDNAYAITNYHVAAWNLMQQNTFSYDVASGAVPDSLTISGVNAVLNKGQISADLDVAFILVGKRASFNNNIGNGNAVNSSDFVQPNSLMPGDQLFAFTNSISSGQTVTVVAGSMPYDPKFKGIKFSQVIALNKYSSAGDSGSLVVDTSFRVVGIVVGADSFSYLIPYALIFPYNPLTII